MSDSNGSGRSLLDEVRGLYAKQTPDGLLYIPVGRKAAGKLVVAYTEQDWLETQETRKQYTGNPDPRAPLYLNAEILAKSCRDIYLRDDEHGVVLRNAGEPLPGKYVPGLGEGGGPVNFHSAAVTLGLPVADDPLAAVFAVLVSDWEVEAHHAVLASWDPGVLPPEKEDAVLGGSGPAERPATSPAGA